MEYTNVAVKGAVAAVDGNIPPINCSEPVKYGHAHLNMCSDWIFFVLYRQRMLIWNNIFLTFAFDGRDNYTDVGGKLP